LALEFLRNLVDFEGTPGRIPDADGFARIYLLATDAAAQFTEELAADQPTGVWAEQRVAADIVARTNAVIARLSPSQKAVFTDILEHVSTFE
jgi:ribosomal protein L9